MNPTIDIWFSLNTTVDYEKLVPGLKLTLDSSFKPDTGDKVGFFTLVLDTVLTTYVSQSKL